MDVLLVEITNALFVSQAIHCLKPQKETLSVKKHAKILACNVTKKFVQSVLKAIN